LKIMIFTILMASALALYLFPEAQRWNTQRLNNEELIMFTNEINELPGTGVNELLLNARAYNQELTLNPLTDITALNARTDVNYRSQLRKDNSAVMVRVIVPNLDIDLPVFHGADESVLLRGVGHMYGTHLPVGGESTHSVITAHSGLMNAHFFTPLLNAEIGDTIIIQVAGETLFYEVYEIFEVLPEQVEYIDIQAGRDLLTLITCTPIGINTHRLLVRAERVHRDDVKLLTTSYLDVELGFPWWLMIFVGGTAGSYVLGRVLLKNKKMNEENLVEVVDK